MKKLFFLGCLFISSAAFAGQYVGVNAGTDYCYHTDDVRGQKVGYQLGAVYGYKFENGLRSEIEMTYRDGQKVKKYVFSDGDDQSTHSCSYSMAYMVNAVYDVVQLRLMEVTPYIGVGLGLSQNTEDLKVKKGKEVINRDKSHDDRFAYQAIVGGKYALNEKLDVAGQYTYHIGRAHAKNHAFGMHLIRSF
jgi:opacity protein-like surface antigen